MVKTSSTSEKKQTKKQQSNSKQQPRAKQQSRAKQQPRSKERGILYQDKAGRINKAKQRIKKDSSFLKDKFLDENEITYMINALNADIINAKTEKYKQKAIRYRLFFLMLLHTGARCSEILDCNICDINEGEITIRGLKGSDTRVIPLPKDLYKEIIEYAELNTQNTSGFLFNTFFTDRYARMRFKRYLPSDCKKSIHSLRHAMGVNSYRKYRDIQLTKQILGHKDIRNTQIYMNYDAIHESKDKIKDIY